MNFNCIKISMVLKAFICLHITNTENEDIQGAESLKILHKGCRVRFISLPKRNCNMLKSGDGFSEFSSLVLSSISSLFLTCHICYNLQKYATHESMYVY